MTVVVTAVFTPAAGSRDQLIEALQQAIPAVHEEPGCLLYAIHDAADESIVMIEKWASDSDLAAHAEGPAVARLNDLIDGLTAKPVVVTTMAPLPAGTHVSFSAVDCTNFRSRLHKSHVVSARAR